MMETPGYTEKYAFALTSLKRTEHEKLEISTVLNTLLKAERERHETLIEACIRFCQTNLELILTQHGNAILDLSDVSVQKIAFLFHHNDADSLKDKKDRIKRPELGCPESGYGLFRCQACGQLLTPSTASRVKCQPGNFTLNEYGVLIPSHDRDEGWDVKVYVKTVYFRLRSWRQVYWLLWGHIHYLRCDRCREFFPCNQMFECYYHPEVAQYPHDPEKNVVHPIGQYPCCLKTACRFDPWEKLSKGCRKRDHVIHPKDPLLQNVHRDLLLHRELVTCPMVESSTSGCSESVDNETVDRSNRPVSNSNSLSGEGCAPSADDETEQSAKNPERAENRQGDGLDVNRETRSDSTSEETDDDEDDDEGDEDSNGSKKDGEDNTLTPKEEPELSLISADLHKGMTVVKVAKAAAVGPSKKPNHLVIWDPLRSRRHNYDVLREYEQRRFHQIQARMQQALLRSSDHEGDPGVSACSLPGSSPECQRNSRTKNGLPSTLLQQQQFYHPGGLYVRIESQWKSLHTPTRPSTSFPQKASVMAIARFKRNKQQHSAS